ncbi:DUF4270 domain-containing protein [Galbibacter pacificus]|uniref:DUF4270 domain-containing protein n=1 Tax=Galbibacter pacificus TaxID=2996052 RepID=A0ABT6FSJ6_9FLAO|nr:DUF4270 domain-containing protein [Galbibacter pacificus]MDG3582637.1 DUF4270 domain-containing protein [Galbibacter pacificus]MDG3586244.1 DUF4270 domain-containing protein [Galbibacter pacificus]
MKKIFKGSYMLTALLVTGSVIFFTACERDYNTIGVDLIDDGSTVTNSVKYDVFTYNRKLESVRTDGLTAYQLSDFNQPVYGLEQTSFVGQMLLGTTDPTFGEKSQIDENAEGQENERATAVYLYIPFFSTALTDTTDLDENEPKPYRIDSIYGNRNTPFTLKVQEYTKFLRDLDPGSNFQDAQEYFSSEDPTSFVTTVLYEDSYTIDEEEILFFNGEDDPDTEDEDESVTVPSERLSPGIWVELDKQFFQEKILDNEGASVLASQNNFKEFLRGLYISMESANHELAMLLNVANAYVEIQYDYDTTNDDDEAVVENSTFKLSLNGNKVNYIDEAAYPATVLDQFNNANASNLYVRGGSGTYVELDMLGGQDPDVAFQEAEENDWLINEANLVFYVDEESLTEESKLTLPKRLYLYDLSNERVLVDYNNVLDTNTGIDSTTKTIFGGILDADNEKGIQYKFRITEYINDIIRKDSTNTRLALTTTNSILNSTNVSAYKVQDGSAETDEDLKIKIPQASIPNQYGTVLFGNNAGNDKKLQLEIFYTKPKED